jgi:hypothetical protein
MNGMKFWKITSIAMPLAWFLELRLYSRTECVSWRGSLVCGNFGKFGLFVLFLFCFSFPVIFLVKLGKNRKTLSSPRSGRPAAKAVENIRTIEPAEFIEALEAMANGELSCRSFRDKYYTSESHVDLSKIPNLLGGLSHYLDDENWRKKDQWQREMQNEELRKLIVLMKNGASEVELQKIHFLGKT